VNPLPENNTPQTAESPQSNAPINERDLTLEIAQAHSQEYISKFDITVTPHDTLKYLNMIAEINGYAPLPSTDNQRKNPHWIWPGNIFDLPDRGKVVVKEGDSMWKIAELLLTQQSIKYYEIMEKLSGAATEEERQKLLKEAEAYTLTEKISEHFKKVSGQNGRDSAN